MKKKIIKKIKNNKKNIKTKNIKNIKTIPKSIWYLKYIKYIQHAFKSQKDKKNLLTLLTEKEIVKEQLKLNRYLVFYQLYKKRKQNYFIFSKTLKKIKKKIKRINLSSYLWKSLTVNNSSDFIRFNNDSIDIDNKLNKIPFSILNYYQNYYQDYKKKKILYKFFNNKNSFIIKNRFNLKTRDGIFNYNVTQNNFLLNFFIYLKHCNLDYYNKYFYKNKIYNSNYIFYFYNIIKNKILLKINKILQNYFNYLILSQENIISENIENIHYFSNFNTKAIINNNMVALKQYINQTSIWTRYLIKKKKWNKNALYFWALKFFKKMIAIYIKINIQFNDLRSIKNKKVEYNRNEKVITDSSKLIVPKFWHHFSNFIHKSTRFNKSILNKYKMNSQYVLKKYYFFYNFIKSYLFKIFSCLKYIYFLDNSDNKIQYYIYKLKFILFLMFYKKFVKKLKVKNWEKKKFKLLVNNSVAYLARNFKTRFYSKIAVPLKHKIKKMWAPKKKNPYALFQALNNKKQERNEKKERLERYRQPITLFKYNPLLNPKHEMISRKKKNKQKRTYKFLYYAIKRMAYKKRRSARKKKNNLKNHLWRLRTANVNVNNKIKKITQVLKLKKKYRLKKKNKSSKKIYWKRHAYKLYKL